MKLFRTDAGISQFDLETELGLGYGSVSRMESNQTIPTRITLRKIADYLKLTDRQFDYLAGSRVDSPSDLEVQNAIKYTSELWVKQNSLVILRDDHYRICEASDGFKKMFGIDKDIWRKQWYLRSILSIMLDPKLPFCSSFNPLINSDAKENLTAIILGFFYEMKFMRLEDDFREIASSIQKNDLAVNIFENLNKVKILPNYYLITERQLKMIIGGKKIKLLFYTEIIPDATRFSVIHLLTKEELLESL